jgi:hypothetical protein
MSVALTPAEREAFLARPHTAVVTFILEDGRSMGVPVWISWTGEVFRFQSPDASLKSASFRRLGRASVCLHEDTTGSVKYVTGEGPVTEIPFDFQRDIADLADRYLGDRGPAFADVFAARDLSGFSTFELAPESWWSRDYAKTPVASIMIPDA